MEIDQSRKEEPHRFLQSPERRLSGLGELGIEVSRSSSRFEVGFLCTELLLFLCLLVRVVLFLSSGGWIMH